jgi:hypothetical protein
MLLQIATGGARESREAPRDKDVVAAIRDLSDDRVDAVILIADDERNLFLQLGRGGRHVEHCVGPGGPNYSTDGVSIETATRMILSYLHGDASWKGEVTWGIEVEQL